VRDPNLFVLYRGLSRAYFHLPILFVFFYASGMPLLAVEILLAAYGVVIILASPLSGRLARRFSLKGIIAIGEVLKVGGVALLALGPDPRTALPGQIIAALGYSLAAGTDSALLSAACKGNADVYRRYESASASALFLAALAGGVTGAALFVQNPTWPFLASAAFSAAALIVVLLMGDAPAPVPGERATPPKLAPRDGFWLSYYAISRAFVLAPYIGFLPYLFYVTLSVEVAWFGAILGVYGVAAFLVARSSSALSAKLGTRRLGWMSMGLCAAALGILAVSPTLWGGLVGVLLLGLGGGVIRPVTMANLNTAMQGWTPAMRTVLLSAQESMYGVWNVGILLVGALVLEAFGVQLLLACLAGTYVVVLLSLSLRSRSLPVARQAITSS
jgi:MFS family permease